jgi:cell division transport system permease protein
VSLLGVLAVGLSGCAAKPAPAPAPASPALIRVAVFLRDGVTEPQKQAIEARLRAVPRANGLHFETREQAYERFKETFKDSPDLVAQTKPEDLPESFRITLTDRAAADPIMAELRRLPGVDEVVTAPEATPTPTR